MRVEMSLIAEGVLRTVLFDNHDEVVDMSFSKLTPIRLEGDYGWDVVKFFRVWKTRFKDCKLAGPEEPYEQIM